MTKIFNRRDRKFLRQHLRKEMPEAEHLLWLQLKSKQLDGWKFRRQHGIGSYIVDFYCPKGSLVIEIDGDSHFQLDAKNKDYIRQKFIESQGIRVLRFTNNDIRESINDVVLKILQNLSPTPPHLPLERGGNTLLSPTPPNLPLERGGDTVRDLPLFKGEQEGVERGGDTL